MSNTKPIKPVIPASSETLLNLLETLPGAVFIVDDDMRIVYANASAQAIAGARREDILGASLWCGAPHLVSTSLYQALQKARHTREPGEVTYHSPVTNTWLQVSLSPTDRGLALVFQQHRESLPFQQALRQQIEDELRTLIDAIPQLVWIMSPDGASEYGNQRWCDYTTLTFPQYQGDGWLQALHPDDVQPTLTLWRHALETGEPFDTEYRLKNGQTGTYRWFLARAMPVRNEAGQVVKWFGTCTDIEDQKQTEEALRKSQERVSALMNSSIIGITVIEEGQIVDTNDAFLRMTGYTHEDLQAGRLNVIDLTAPEDRARTRQAHQELLTQQTLTPYEKAYLCQDGSRLPVLVGGIVIQRHPRQAIGFVLDNSARKELEQRKDDFISMASHELRNPLTALKLQNTMLSRQLAKQGILNEAPALASMETQINKVTRLVEELLDVSKIQAGKLEYVQERVNLDALLREIVEILQHTNPSHTILVHGAVGTDLIGDPDRLGQVFINLLNNAIKYSPDAQDVEMDLSTSEDAVTVQVRDHGLGIPREQRARIFERFYRVSGSRQKAIPGLGMGLYIVSEIVTRHGGSITVDSAVGKGSTFTVTLPRNRAMFLCHGQINFPS